MMTSALKRQGPEPSAESKQPLPELAEKLELQGLLGVGQRWQGSKVSFQYRLETRDFDVFLKMDRRLQKQAQSYLWEEVKVRGHWDEYQMLFHVDALFPQIQDLETWDKEAAWEDTSLESLEQQIRARGRLDTEDSL